MNTPLAHALAAAPFAWSEPLAGRFRRLRGRALAVASGRPIPRGLSLWLVPTGPSLGEYRGADAVALHAGVVIGIADAGDADAALETALENLAGPFPDDFDHERGCFHGERA